MNYMLQVNNNIVRTIFFIAAAVLFLPFSALSQGRDRTGAMDTVKGVAYFIRVGDGIGGVKLGSATLADVQRIFGKGKLRQEKTTRNGVVYIDKTITYKMKGLKFFAVNKPDSTATVYSIEITQVGARTERDVIIGTSNQVQVILAYGEPSYKSPANITYDNLGVVFSLTDGVVDRIIVSQTTK